MVIDWTAAPEGTTHATTPNGDPRWYKLEGGKVLCWATRLNEWAPSFFLTVDEIADTGLRLYANGEQSELVILREQRDALMAAATIAHNGGLARISEGEAMVLLRKITAPYWSRETKIQHVLEAIALVEGTK